MASPGGSSSRGLVVAILVVATKLTLSLNRSTAAPSCLLPRIIFASAATNDADGENAPTSAREACDDAGSCIADGRGGGGVDGDVVVVAVPPKDDDGEINVANDATGGGDIVTRRTHASNSDRLISHDELELHTTTDERIWLSILGRVYDVNVGEDYHGALKGGYKFYAGWDASPCFATGQNTPDGAVEDKGKWETKKQPFDRSF